MRQPRMFVVQLGVKVNFDQDERLTALARREGCTVSTVIREAIEHHLQRAEQPVVAPVTKPTRQRLAHQG